MVLGPFGNALFTLGQTVDFLAHRWYPDNFQVWIIDFLYCVIVSFVIGCTMPKQSSSMLMMGLVHCELVVIFMALSVMTWCIVWMEMLPSMHGWMILVERRGGMGTWLVSWLGLSSSGSITVYQDGAVLGAPVYSGLGVCHGWSQLVCPSVDQQWALGSIVGSLV